MSPLGDGKKYYSASVLNSLFPQFFPYEKNK
jgi:hypothetical protein